MAKGVLSVIIELIKKGGGDKEAIKGLANLKNAISTATMTAGAFMAVGYGIKSALEAIINPLVAYADQVRRISNATGMGAEDSSRLIQVLDDLKISYEDLEKVVQKNGKTYDYSIEGLARMSDEYLTLTDSQEQAAFMQERFGKNWITFVPAMQKGGDALREASESIADNMVLTERALIEARQYEIAVDDLTDAWTGFKYEIGNAVLPAMNDLIHAQDDHSRALEIMRENGEPVYNGMRQVSAAALEQARAERLAASAAKEQAAAMEEGSASATDHAAALEAVSAKNRDLLGLVGKLQSQQDSYNAQYQAIAEKQKLTDDERAAKFAELAAEHDKATKQIILGLLEQKLAQDGLTDAELGFLLEKGQAWGLYSATVIQEAQAAIAEANAVNDAINSIQETKNVKINVQSNYADAIQELSGYYMSEKGAAPSRASAATGSNKRKHAAGGSFVIPRMYGYEGFDLGGMATASGGETVTITPNAGGGGGGGMIAVNLTINSPVTVMDEQRVKQVLLPYIVDGIRQAQARGVVRP